MNNPVLHQISRRSLLSVAAATTAMAALAAPAGAAPVARPSRAVRPATGDLGQQLLDEWSASPSTHRLLGDFTHAGYRLGSPRPHPRVVANVKQYGAKGDGATDDLAAFNAAVRTVGESGGGTVLVPDGTYHLSGPLFIHWSNVVVRGASTADTVLYFSRPLKEGYRDNWQASKNQDRWSWAGGQIWVIPEPVKSKLEVEEWLGTEGWIPGATLAAVAPAPRGTSDVTVSSTAGLREGQMVLLETENPADAGLLVHLAGDTEGARAYDWPVGAPQLVPGTEGFYPQYGTLQWPVRIEKILDGATVRLAQPVKHDLSDRWPSVLRELGPAVTEVGIERLTIRNKLITQTRHNQNPGSNGVHFQAAHDCWADRIRVENTDVGFGLTGAKSVTMSRVTVAGRATHHPFVIRMQSHDNLIEDFEVEPFTVPSVAGAWPHGINAEGLSSGNVYHRGVMAEGTFDSHRALPFENLRSNIRINNTGRVGGAAQSGPYFGARNAHWGIEVTNGRPYAVCLSDVAPASVTLDVAGVTSDTSELRPDYPGGPEALESVSSLDPTVVEDLYEAQRGARR
ncbi:glycoside hydrolase family 55 protein [Georgenia sp. EYE_87]|uniref:glycoside hydrolase family 55 protein n=1 Tax=Georgenia sp. EYE_87 TaxID=2853448 RepID=UPI002003A845|nr:glycoside hydrolase family 55 protein [Georgenia sp. EYE_87]MCK6210844.1 glycoside hydrolase family 55 protein [Georgenia sp. EYE_87]